MSFAVLKLYATHSSHLQSKATVKHDAQQCFAFQLEFMYTVGQEVSYSRKRKDTCKAEDSSLSYLVLRQVKPQEAKYWIERSRQQQRSLLRTINLSATITHFMITAEAHWSIFIVNMRTDT